MIQQQIYRALKPLVSGRCFYGLIPETNKAFPVIVYQFPKHLAKFGAGRWRS